MTTPLHDALDAMRVVANDLERAAGRLRSTISLIAAPTEPGDRIYLKYDNNTTIYELDEQFTTETDDGWASTRWRVRGATNWITSAGFWSSHRNERIDAP